uniref:Uncharacterized protein n=1 Tax=Anguilla anguilla TaxID=7936 RepID=A0A0E9R7J4_ANGAN
MLATSLENNVWKSPNEHTIWLYLSGLTNRAHAAHVGVPSPCGQWLSSILRV